MVADQLTKILPREVHEKHCRQFMTVSDFTADPFFRESVPDEIVEEARKKKAKKKKEEEEEKAELVEALAALLEAAQVGKVSPPTSIPMSTHPFHPYGFIYPHSPCAYQYSQHQPQMYPQPSYIYSY